MSEWIGKDKGGGEGRGEIKLIFLVSFNFFMLYIEDSVVFYLENFKIFILVLSFYLIFWF